MPSAFTAWNLVPCAGTWREQTGALKAGTWKVTIPTRLTSAAGPKTIVPAGVFASGSLNTATEPSLSVAIPATDDPDVTETGWQAVVEVTFTSGAAEKYVIDVPIATEGSGGINLHDYQPVGSSIAAQLGSLGIGVPGGVAVLDVLGQVLDGSGNPVGGGGGSDPEAVRDVIGTALAQAGYATVTVNDAGDTITIGTAASLQTALNAKAPLASPTFTGTVAGVTKAMVGLGNVDNTADASKALAGTQITTGQVPIARLPAGVASGLAVLNASGQVLDGSGNPITGGGGLDSEGVRDVIATALVQAGYASVTVNDLGDTITIGTTAALQTALDSKAPLASPTFTGTVAGVTKAMVGLGNVDNTADTAKAFAGSQITSGTVPVARIPSGINLDNTVDSAARFAVTAAQQADIATIPALTAEVADKADATVTTGITGAWTFSTRPVVPDAVDAGNPLTKRQFDAKVLDTFSVLLASDVTWTGTGTSFQDVTAFTLPLGSSTKNRWLSFEGKIFSVADTTGDYKGTLAFTGAGVTYKVFGYALAVGATINVSSTRVDVMTNAVPGSFLGAGLTPDEVPFKLEGEIYVPADITASIQMRHSPASLSGTVCKTMAMSSMHAVTWRQVAP